MRRRKHRLLTKRIKRKTQNSDREISRGIKKQNQIKGPRLPAVVTINHNQHNTKLLTLLLLSRRRQVIVRKTRAILRQILWSACLLRVSGTERRPSRELWARSVLAICRQHVDVVVAVNRRPCLHNERSGVCSSQPQGTTIITSDSGAVLHHNNR